LHQIRPRPRPQQPGGQFRPRAEKHAGAGDHDYRAAARLDYCVRGHYRDRVPVAGHGADVHPGGDLCRYPGDGGVSGGGRGFLCRHQPRRRPFVLCRRPAPADRARGRAWLSMAELAAPGALPSERAARSRWRRVADSDLLWSFRRSPVTVGAAIVAAIIIAAALAAPLVAPHDPFDLASLSLLDASNPPPWLDGGSWNYPVGTDNQGRDEWSAI